MDLKNLLQVATIVGDTAESIKLNNIFNEVLPSTCKSITTYVSIATDAWKGDNVLDPSKALDPSKTSIPELEDPDNKKVKKRITEDTEAWFAETALDEDGKEHEEAYTNLQVLFQGALKAKLKGKDKEVAKAAQKFIEGPCSDNTVDMFFGDFELEKEDKEIFQDPYTNFEALCKTKLKKAFRDQEDEIGDVTISKKRVKYLRECIDPAV